MARNHVIPAETAILNAWLAGLTPEEMQKLYPAFTQPEAIRVAHGLMESLNLLLHNTTLEPSPWQSHA